MRYGQGARTFQRIPDYFSIGRVFSRIGLLAMGRVAIEAIKG